MAFDPDVDRLSLHYQAHSGRFIEMLGGCVSPSSGAGLQAVGVGGVIAVHVDTVDLDS